MLLEDATSKEQVEQALESGDEELRQSIEDFLDEAKRAFKNSESAYGEEEYPFEHEGVDNFFAGNDLFLKMVIENSPAKFDLSTVPTDLVNTTITDTLQESNKSYAGSRDYDVWGPFAIAFSEDRYSPSLEWSYDIKGDRRIYFSIDQFPDETLLDKIPESFAGAFWDDLASELDVHEWVEGTEHFGDNIGYATGYTTYSFGPYKKEKFDEWCADIVREHITDLMDKNPLGAATEIINRVLTVEDAQIALKLLAEEKLTADEINSIGVNIINSASADDEEIHADLVNDFTSLVHLKHDPSAAEKILLAGLADYPHNMPYEQHTAFVEAIKQGKVSKSELVELAERWVHTEDKSDLIDEIIDFVGAVGVQVPRQSLEERALLTVTKADLKHIGITTGVFWEMAPWHLINLSPAELGEEGRKMRHCVGDHGMSYARAVKAGELEIWSLRDHSNKPRFTLEVDGAFRKGQGPQTTNVDPKTRAALIRQLKGKANRTPGFIDRDHQRRSHVSFEDEVAVWRLILKKLHVAPEHVVDFQACRVPTSTGQAAMASTWRLAAKIDKVADYLRHYGTPHKILAVLEDTSFLLSD